jgi:hypothetical protein
MTTFTTQTTTTSPQKHHNQTPFFAKTPAKTHLHHNRNKTPQKDENICTTDVILRRDPASYSVGREYTKLPFNPNRVN